MPSRSLSHSCPHLTIVDSLPATGGRAVVFGPEEVCFRVPLELGLQGGQIVSETFAVLGPRAADELCEEALVATLSCIIKDRIRNGTFIASEARGERGATPVNGKLYEVREDGGWGRWMRHYVTPLDAMRHHNT